MIIKKILNEITFFGGIGFFSFILFIFFILKKEFYFYFLFIGLILIYFFTFLIRIFYFKPRPKKIQYNNFLSKLDASSFPSVHAARVTFLLIFLIAYLKQNIIVISIAGIFFLLVCYSRIYLKKHYKIDVFSGILLGIGVFLLVFLGFNF